MAQETSPHSSGLRLKRIDLPEPIIVYFQKRGRFVRNLPSYEQIEGRNAVIPDTARKELFLDIFIVETYPVDNQDDESRIRAESRALELLSIFTRSKKPSISKLSRTYMLTGYTKPIKISCLLDKKADISVYVKKPSTERIFGMLLYNLLSGNPEQDYIFNNYSFVERGIFGEHLNDFNKKGILMRQRFRESIVRLAELDDFISINDLERRIGPKNAFGNFLVGYDGNVVAFDFNTLFQPETGKQKSPLVDAVRAAGIDIQSEFEGRIRDDEARRIRGRVNENRRAFERIAELIDGVPYMIDRINEKGYKSAEQYFKIKLSKLRK